MAKIISKEELLNCKYDFTLINLVGQMGDIVACEPIIRYIKKIKPNDLIIWLVFPQFYEVLIAHPDLDFIVFVDHLHDSFLLANQLPENCTYINLNLDALICNKTFNLVNNNPKINLSNYYFYGNLLKVFSLAGNLPVINDEPRFHILPFIKPPTFLPENYVVLHCCSTGIFRNWSKESWTSLSNVLIHSGYNLVEVGLVPVAKPADNLLYGYYDLTNNNHIQIIAAIIKNAKFFIGIDSGFAHIANALKINGLVIIGRMVPFINHNPFSGLYSSSKYHVRSLFKPAKSISVKKVLKAFFKANKYD
jgi:ADP-heptose:LPS heptosyltransferase